MLFACFFRAICNNPHTLLVTYNNSENYYTRLLPRRVPRSSLKPTTRSADGCFFALS